jgi:predicted nucleic acid-binding protein
VLLVDTSVWIDHLRSGDSTLVALLERQQVLAHDFVIGEIALGNLRQRDTVMAAMKGLPRATRASAPEVLTFIERESLHGLGIGYIDAHLLASVRLTPGSSLWTRDKRLAKIAGKLGIAASA